MYWEIVPTARGCQLFVDGVPIGSDAEPPPSGWLQRQYGILMPPEYEQARLMCMGVGPGEEDCLLVPVYETDQCPPGYVYEDTYPTEDGEDLELLCCPPTRAFAGYGGLPAATPCEMRTPPFANTPMRDGDCVWVPGQGWVTRPCPTREDFLPYCDPCTGMLCGDFILPGDEFCPPMCPSVAGARRATSPARTRKCYTKVTHKGLWVCCQGTCKLAVRTPM